MIDDDCRYFSLTGHIRIGGPSTWHVIDWDQRRVISVTMAEEQDTEDLAIQYLSRCIDQVPPGTYEVFFSPTGGIISKKNDPAADQMYCVHYPQLHEASLPVGIQTIRRDALEELDRFGPDTDLVAYPPCSTSAQKVVFKYYYMWQYMHMCWKELNLWMRLPHHPNIVPFDRVVLDELEGRVIGFTSVFIPGKNLKDNYSRVFKLAWLRQLTQVVDDLNLRYGIAHQDIAPRNLLIDEPTDCIMVCDFNYAARKEKQPARKDGDGEFYEEDRNDIKGVVFTMYEVITLDESLRGVPHDEQDLAALQQRDWVQHPEVRLDHSVAAFQRVLQEWQQRRAAGPDLVHSSQAPEAVNWPPRPDMPKVVRSVANQDGSPGFSAMETPYETRQVVLARGGKFLGWERPPQTLINQGVRVLSTGAVVDCEKWGLSPSV